MEGVLKSFAIPKGFSYFPAHKHLAVRTEDHPLEYYDFEGVIPKGQYGAGTMKIWDRGEYELLNVPPTDEGISSGELKFILHGTRARGEWHLVKTRRSEKDWLFFKSRDAYARAEGEAPFPFDVEIASAARKPPVTRRKPMRPGNDVAPFSDPGWLFELEFAGLRAFAMKDGDSVTLRDASTGKLVTADVDEVTDEVARLHAHTAVLDGVLVALDEQERPCREALAARLAGANGVPLFYYAFDLLHFDDWRLGAHRLYERKRLLGALLPPSRRLLYVDHVLGEGASLSATVATAGLTGVIAKRSLSTYKGGASEDWRRVPATPAAAGAESVADALGAAAAKSPGRVKISNRDKVFWPEAGLTKGDLIDYYGRVAELLLPHLHERPIHMQRFPDGIDGKAFYHKDAPDHVPGWVETERIASESKSVNYIICNDRDTLLLLANLASIDMHPWMSRRTSPDTPDWFVLDLDPKGAPFAHVVRIARALGKLLRGIGLRPYLKTSGKTGLHITVPLVSAYTYEQARMFAEMVARAIVNEHGEIATVERSVGRREGKVYVDYLQNSKGQTVVPPYSARPVPAASVSMPLDWDELDSDLDPAHFTIVNAPHRLAERGDLFRGVLTDQQGLGPALAAFQEHFGPS